MSSKQMNLKKWMHLIRISKQKKETKMQKTFKIKRTKIIHKQKSKRSQKLSQLKMKKKLKQIIRMMKNNKRNNKRKNN